LAFATPAEIFESRLCHGFLPFLARMFSFVGWVERRGAMRNLASAAGGFRCAQPTLHHLPLEPLELGECHIGCVAALILCLPYRIELAFHKHDDVLSAGRAAARRASQIVADAADVAVPEPHRPELGVGHEGIANVPGLV